MVADRASLCWLLRRPALALALCIATASLLPRDCLAEPREVTLRERLVALHEAYPEHIAAINETHVKMKSGREFIIDDGRKKTHAEKLDDADIEDMLSQIYPLAGCLPHYGTLDADYDPGRIREEDFFKAVYGIDSKAIETKLVSVDWFGQKLRVIGTLGVDRHLAAVKAELQPLFAKLKTHLVPSAGTFNWRTIAGTKLLSTHSYAIAIDIASSDYWRWSKITPQRIAAVRKKIPIEIVQAFERHGFIWGGNWYHFDTMHFEYRPELIAIAKLAKERGCAR